MNLFWRLMHGKQGKKKVGKHRTKFFELNRDAADSAATGENKCAKHCTQERPEAFKDRGKRQAEKRVVTGDWAGREDRHTSDSVLSDGKDRHSWAPGSRRRSQFP